MMNASACFDKNWHGNVLERKWPVWRGNYAEFQREFVLCNVLCNFELKWHQLLRELTSILTSFRAFSLLNYDGTRAFLRDSSLFDLWRTRKNWKELTVCRRSANFLKIFLRLRRSAIFLGTLGTGFLFHARHWVLLKRCHHASRC